MKNYLAVLAGLLVWGGAVQAGTLAGERYVGERYGRLEIAPPAGSWEIVDRESSGAAPEGGPVADLQLRQAVAGHRPVVRITGVRKVDASVNADAILRTSRDAFVEAGGETGPVSRVAVAGRSVSAYDGRIVAAGQPARSRLVLVEGRDSFFLLQMVVPAAAFDEAAKAFDQLLPALRY